MWPAQNGKCLLWPHWGPGAWVRFIRESDSPPHPIHPGLHTPSAAQTSQKTPSTYTTWPSWRPWGPGSSSPWAGTPISTAPRSVECTRQALLRCTVPRLPDVESIHTIWFSPPTDTERFGGRSLPGRGKMDTKAQDQEINVFSTSHHSDSCASPFPLWLRWTLQDNAEYFHFLKVSSQTNLIPSTTLSASCHVS